MIRRTFLKALCASPLGFLIPKAGVELEAAEYAQFCLRMKKGPKYMRGEGLEALKPLRGIPVDNFTFDEIELMPQWRWVPFDKFHTIPPYERVCDGENDIRRTFNDEGKFTGWRWKVKPLMFTVYKDGKTIDKFPI